MILQQANAPPHGGFSIKRRKARTEVRAASGLSFQATGKAEHRRRFPCSAQRLTMMTMVVAVMAMWLSTCRYDCTSKQDHGNDAEHQIPKLHGKSPSIPYRPAFRRFGMGQAYSPRCSFASNTSPQGNLGWYNVPDPFIRTSREIHLDCSTLDPYREHLDPLLLGIRRDSRLHIEGPRVPWANDG